MKLIIKWGKSQIKLIILSLIKFQTPNMCLPQERVMILLCDKVQQLSVGEHRQWEGGRKEGEGGGITWQLAPGIGLAAGVPFSSEFVSLLPHRVNDWQSWEHEREGEGERASSSVLQVQCSKVNRTKLCRWHVLWTVDLWKWDNISPHNYHISQIDLYHIFNTRPRF